jgi:ribonucleoside-diphosphate reductase alpha chain
MSDMLVYPIPDYEKDYSTITEDDCYMYGIILGDGSMSNKTETSGHVTMHTINKQSLADFMINYLENSCTQYSVNVDNNTTIIRWNQNLNLPFRYNDFYDENKEKRLQNRWLHLPMNKAKFILKGLLETDGCNKNELVFDSTSYNLIESVRYLCLRMGILTSGYVRNRVGQKHETDHGSIENKKISYCLRIPKTEDICNLLDSPYDDNQYFKFMRHDNLLFTRIKGISNTAYNGTLYDLQMKDKHNYMIHNGLIHNGEVSEMGHSLCISSPGMRMLRCSYRCVRIMVMRN